MDDGRMSESEDAQTLSNDERIRQAYLGAN
jgi:hypothetical protein